MAKLFIGIALVVMLATAALGFLAKGNIDKLQSSLKDTKGHIQQAEVQAKNAKGEAEKATAALKDATDKADAAAKTAAELKTQAEGKDTEIAKLNEQIKALAAKGTTPEGKDLKPELEAAQKDATEAKARADEMAKKADDAAKERDEAKQLYASQQEKYQQMQGQVSELTKEKTFRDKQIQKPGLQGRILAVNGGWNFVVLSVGDKQGVIVNSSLLVVRGNEPIARLRVTSVEPSTSIADVLPGTVRKGASVQAGDTVIFEGTRNQAVPAAAKSAPEAPAAAPTISPLPN